MLVDTLIHARWLVPIEPDNTVYDNHSVVINQGKIVAILPTEQAMQQYQAHNTRELLEHVVLPGLVNCHTHSAMSLLRGIADDLPLMDWLQHHIWPLEQRWMSEEFVRDGTQLAIAEMLLGGTTCFNDMYFFPDITAQQAIEQGIRASIGLIVIDFPSVWAENSAHYIEKGLALREQLAGEPLISLTFAPHAPYSVSDKPFQDIQALSAQFKLPVHCHIHETAQEIQQAAIRPLQRLHELGLVNDKLIAVHATQLNDADIELLATAGAHIVHCPESNLKLASGFCPVAQCLAAGINVALGTDGAASNNDLNLLAEMRTAALLAKAVANDASAVPAMTALKMATINGAKALGLDDKIGSLSAGKAADVIAVDLSAIQTQPLYDVVSQLVYAVNSQQVTDVWVAGEPLVINRQLTRLDVDVLRAQVAVWQQRLKSLNQPKRS